MKTVMENKKGTKTFAVLAFALVSILMSGCGKSDNGPANNGVVGPYGIPACGACGGMSSPFVSTVGEDPVESIFLQLYTTTSGTMPLGYNNYQASGQQIAATGSFTINQMDGVCVNQMNGQPILPGTYQITTVQPGAYNGSQSFGNLILQASGPSQITIVINSAYINLTAQSGYPANPSYPTPYGYNSQYGFQGQQAQARLLITSGYINQNRRECQLTTN